MYTRGSRSLGTPRVAHKTSPFSSSAMLVSARDFLSASWANSLLTGLCAILLLPLAFVPLGKLLTKRKRSINKHVYNEIPKNYWFVTCRAFSVVGLFSGLLFGFAARSPNFRWEYNQATLFNTVGAGILCLAIREFLNYWVHRLFHSRLLYKHVHYQHHAIAHPGSGPYDAFYGHLVDSIIGIAVIYFPFTIGFECHVIALIMNIAILGIFGLVLNHSGREFAVTVWLPCLGSLKIYDSSDHDDHHVHRHGNYADLLPFLDKMFGTELVIADKRRHSVPAERLWGKLRDHVLSNAASTSPPSSNLARNSILEEEGRAEIERFVSQMHDYNGNATRTRLRPSWKDLSLAREFAYQLLEEHPECRSSMLGGVCPDVMERRRSSAFEASFALSSPTGRRLSTLAKKDDKTDE